MKINSYKSRYTIQSAKIDGGHLLVTWEDSHTSRYHPIWLRHQCECRVCGSSLNGVRNIRIHHIPEDITPTQVQLTDNCIYIIWSGDHHCSTYTANWLRDNCNSDSERNLRKHKPVLWDASICNDIPITDFEQVKSHPSTQLVMLEAVCDFGFCKVVNVPTDQKHSNQLTELVGPQRQTHFGVYPLSKKTKVDNVGDTTSALDPHIDETYRISGIGITIFQVLRPSTNGGDSTLVDGFEAARRLQQTYPEDFNLLTKVSVTGHRLDNAHNTGGQPKWYVSHLPVIKLDDENNVCGVRLNERQIAGIDASDNLVGPSYAALRRIFNILYEPELRLNFPLNAGEGLLFNNQRILHGRTSFTPEDPARHVLTSSVDLEDFYSTLRLLQADQEIQGPPISYLQGIGG